MSELDPPVAECCPLCGGPARVERCKLVCARCHVVLANCNGD